MSDVGLDAGNYRCQHRDSKYPNVVFLEQYGREIPRPAENIDDPSEWTIVIVHSDGVEGSEGITPTSTTAVSSQSHDTPLTEIDWSDSVAGFNLDGVLRQPGMTPPL